MKHPFLTKNKYILYYFIGWLPIALGYSGFLQVVAKIELTTALIDGFVYSFIFAFLGLGIWYITYFKRLEDSEFGSWLLVHVSSAILIVAAWNGIGIAILSLIGQHVRTGDGNYLSYNMVVGVALYFTIMLIYYLIIVISEKQQKAMNEERLVRLANESELKALKSQINPHFLFNSLNSANFLTQTNPKQAGEMLVKLSDYLRYSLKKTDTENVPLSEEIANCRRYIELEKCRFGEKICEFWELDPQSMHTQIPLMLLQPLYENAIKHGVYESTSPIDIKTVTSHTAEGILITITNTLDPEAITLKGEGIGLKNIAARLSLVYKRNDLLRIKKEQFAYSVSVFIPKTA